MKKLGIIILCMVLLTTLFTGCSSTLSNSDNVDKSTAKANERKEEKQIPELTGEWNQANSKSKDSYQIAKISGDTIEIYWLSDNGDTKSLYWAGTFVTPTTDEEPYKWDSKNDHSKTDNALLASSDDTKTMTYQNGIISYQASAMGTTTTIKLEKQE